MALCHDRCEAFGALSLSRPIRRAANLFQGGLVFHRVHMLLLHRLLDFHHHALPAILSLLEPNWAGNLW